MILKVAHVFLVLGGSLPSLAGTGVRSCHERAGGNAGQLH